MLGLDVRELLEQSLSDNQRPGDGKLHPSGDLIGSLRHAQLRAAGAPTIPREITGDVNLMTGTLWHSHFETIFRDARMPVMVEVKLDEWLPEGWAGTADWLVWDREYKAFVLKDLKTTRPEAIPYIQNEGIKEEHLWQLSAYYYALEEMGLPLVKGFEVFYLPKYFKEGVEPLQLEGQPIPKSIIHGLMDKRWKQTKEYLTILSGTTHYRDQPLEDFWRVGALAPEQERVLVVRPNAKMEVIDLKLEPHWSSRFCQFPDELCGCRHQKAEKVGSYHYDIAKDETFYTPRKGYHAIQPDVKPTKTQERQLREWDAINGRSNRREHT